MPAPYRTKIFALAAKIETTPGVDSAPTFAANAIRLVGVPTLALTPLETGDQADVQTNGLLRAPRQAPQAQVGTLDVTVVMQGKRSAGGVPPHGVLLRGAGFSETIVATGGSETVTYTTLDTGMETFTLLLTTAEAKQRLLVGCVVTNATRAGTAGQRGVWTFSIRGLFIPSGTNPQAAAITGLSLPSTIAPQWVANTVLIGDAAGTPEWGPASTDPLVAKAFTLALNGTASDQPAAGAATGVLNPVITDRAPSLELHVRAVSPAIWNPEDAARSDGTGVGGAVTHDTRVTINTGTQQYHREKIETGFWELGYPADEEYSPGLAGWSLTGPVNSFNGPGGRELRITYS